MCYLANVITEERFDGGFLKELYNVVKNENEAIDGIPTLIIGWDKVKKLYPKASILNTKIQEDVYWTYGKRQRRERYEADSDNFKTYILKSVQKKIKYVFFNVFTEDKESKKKLFSTISDNTQKYCLISNNIVYILYPKEKICYGISLDDIEYEGGDKKKFLAKIFGSPTVKIVKENEFMTYEAKTIIGDRKYIIPYLSYIQDARWQNK